MTDATVTALKGGDSVNYQLLYHAADGANCATDVRARAVVVRYI